MAPSRAVKVLYDIFATAGGPGEGQVQKLPWAGTGLSAGMPDRACLLSDLEKTRGPAEPRAFIKRHKPRTAEVQPSQPFQRFDLPKGGRKVTAVPQRIPQRQDG